MILRSAILIGCALLHTGCILLAIERNTTQEIDQPILTAKRATFDCHPTLRTPHPISSLQRITKQQLEKAWGAPDQIELINEHERWIYKAGLRWNGFFGIFVIAPLPLIIPTGHKTMIVEFSDNILFNVRAHYNVMEGFGCGFFPVQGGGLMCEYEEASYLYGLNSSFCGYGKRIDPINE